MQKRRSPKFNAVYLEWDDSESTYGWQRVKDQNYRPCPIRSIGIIAKEDKDHITISTSHSRNDSYVDVLTIPKVAITYIKRFKY